MLLASALRSRGAGISRVIHPLTIRTGARAPAGALTAWKQKGVTVMHRRDFMSPAAAGERAPRYKPRHARPGFLARLLPAGLRTAA